MRALALLLLIPASALGQTIIVGDALIADQLSVGTTSVGGRVFVQASSSTEIPFQVSGVDETPFLQVDKAGRLGVDLAPSAGLDLWGVADSSDTGMQLRNGDRFPDSSSLQMTFGYNGSQNLRHALKTVHSTAATSNELRALLWTPAVSTTAVATLQVLALQTTHYAPAVQIDPVAALPDADLEVSDGSSPGNGLMLSGGEFQPSSRRWKTDIQSLAAAAEDAALSDLLSLKHSRFRMKRRTKKGLVANPKAPLLSGLILEEAPAALRSGSALSFDERLAGAELGFKALARELEQVEEEARRLP